MSVPQIIQVAFKRFVAAGDFGPLTEWVDNKPTSNPRIDKATGRPLFGQSTSVYVGPGKPQIVTIQTLNPTPSGAESGDDLELVGLQMSFYSSNGKLGITFTADQIKSASASSPSKPADPRPAA